MNDEKEWNKDTNPVLIITNPKVVANEKYYTTFDYSKSHVIYMGKDLGSLEELKSMKDENEKLRQWDCNKDTRNSRQRVANKKLIKDNERLKEENEQLKRTLTILAADVRAYESFKKDFLEQEKMLKASVKYYVDILTDLKKWLEEDEEKAMISFEAGKHFNYKDVLNKIKELEEKNNV